MGEKVLIALEACTELTAVAGGACLMARLDGSLLRVAPSALAGIVGGVLLGAAMLLLQRQPYALELAMVTGVALVIFEIVEFAAVGFMPLQACKGVVGLIVLGMAARRWVADVRPRPHVLRSHRCGGYRSRPCIT